MTAKPQMKVRILTTSEIREVTPNVAHDLVERGVAEVYRGQTPEYKNREMKSKPKKQKASKRRTIYTNRQMRTR